jgi:hypothetical protein
VTSEDLQDAMPPRQRHATQTPRSHPDTKEFGRQDRQEERSEDGEETPNGGADWPHVAAVPAAVADPGLSPQEQAIAAADARQGKRRRQPKAIA